MIKQSLEKLTAMERQQLESLARKVGMSVEEWVEFSQKAQIYHNAKEILTGQAA